MSNFYEICGFYVKIDKVVFIADAPARAFLQCVKGHNAKVGCSYCKIEGIYRQQNCFLFSKANNISMISRCDSAYKIGNENKQLSVSPLASVTDLRCNFPPEFMHSVCLGVVRKMCSYFLCM